jgi:hypothetical protein
MNMIGQIHSSAMRTLILIVILFSFLPSFAQITVLDTFYYTGATQTFVIPPCTSNLTVHLQGAHGSNGTPGYLGGEGGRVWVVIQPTAGVIMNINVGGKASGKYGGFNGGGNGGEGMWAAGGGGGGASDIRIGGTSLSDRIFVAGGGGGGGATKIGYTNMGTPYGGEGGGWSCSSWSNTPIPSCATRMGCGGTAGNAALIGPAAACFGGNSNGYAAGGGGGGMYSGGAASTNTSGCPGGAGTLGQGGNGGDSTCSSSLAIKGRLGAGGGGGGYYGGGGGHSGGISFSNTFFETGGGGGGSSYLDSTFVMTYSLYGFGGTWSNGNGLVTISYILNGPGVSASSSANNICSGGTVTLIAGGVSSYTWLPSGSFAGSSQSVVVVSPSTTTQYTVLGLNSFGCTSQTVLTVNVGSGALSVAAIPSGSVCSGGTVALSVSGATTFTWSGSVQNNVPFTPQVSSVYSVTATDSSGCTSTKTIAIQVLPSSTVSIGPPFPATCPGNSVTLTANATGTNYLWSNGGTTQSVIVTPTVTTTYSVMVSSTSNSLCASNGSVQVLVYPVPVLTVSVSQTTICLNDPPVTISAGGALTYTWITAGSSGTVNGGSMNVTPSAITVYSVTGVAATGCKGNSDITINVNACVGMSEVGPMTKIIVYPNPNNGEFQISSDRSLNLSLFNGLGQQIDKIKLDDNHNVSTLKNLASGIYFLVSEDPSLRISEKIIVTAP